MQIHISMEYIGYSNNQLILVFSIIKGKYVTNAAQRLEYPAQQEKDLRGL